MKWLDIIIGFIIGIWFTIFTMEHNKFYKSLVEKNKVEICKDYKEIKDEIK